MKIWKILSPKVLTTEERPDNITSATQAKVKITRVLLSDGDFRAFGGTSKPHYPVIPGRFAVGVVTETGAECLNVEKNTRVFLHDVIPCRNCPDCLSGKPENCTSPRTGRCQQRGVPSRICGRRGIRSLAPAPRRGATKTRCSSA